MTPVKVTTGDSCVRHYLHKYCMRDLRFTVRCSHLKYQWSTHQKLPSRRLQSDQSGRTRKIDAYVVWPVASGAFQRRFRRGRGPGLEGAGEVYKEEGRASMPAEGSLSKDLVGEESRRHLWGPERSPQYLEHGLMWGGDGKLTWALEGLNDRLESFHHSVIPM